MMLLAFLSLLAVANGRRRHSHSSSSSSSSEESCAMTEARVKHLVSTFSTTTTTAADPMDPVTLYCRLKADKDFPHWTQGCPDATDSPTLATTTAPPTETTTTAAPTVMTTTAAPTTTKADKPPVDVSLLDAEDDDGPGIRRLLRRGRHGHGRGGGDARTAFTVSAGQIYGFKNKGGCRDDSSFTCFDDLPDTDCAYTDISVASVVEDSVVPYGTVTLTLTSRADSDGIAQTFDLVCPFEGKVEGDDCTAPEAEMIECRHQNYEYGTTHRFDLECSTVETTWTDRDGTAYPECPQALQ